MVNQQALALPPEGNFISNSSSLVANRLDRLLDQCTLTCISQHVMVKSQPSFSVKISFYRILDKCLGAVWFRKNLFKIGLA